MRPYTPAKGQSMTTQFSNGLSCQKILVVDDHILFREGLTSLLRSTSYFEVVGSAGSVYEAIQLSRELRPEIILMDFSMPDGTGIDATRVILPELPHCKIVFLTMYESDDKLFEALRAGAKGYLPKNTPSPNLTASLRALSNGEMALSRQLMSRVVDEFSRTVRSEPNERDFSRLSVREWEVLHELENGASNQEIAQHLCLSENTVKHHIRSILEKLQVPNRREAGLMAANRSGPVDRPLQSPL
jgi:two-component system, NarL family, nitrate/nitrite response regulator NarL